MGVSMRNPALWFAALFISSVLCLTARAQTNEPSPQPAERPGGNASATQQQSPDVTDTSTPSDQAGEKKFLKESEGSGDKGRTHLRLGTVWLGASYSHYSGPYYYPYGPYGFYPGDWVYGSLWYPIWSPYYPPGHFDFNDGRGEIRLTADPKVAEVYIDGAYAGTADRLKSMWLDPGAYDLTVSAADRASFHQRVYVLSGKSLKITAKLNADSSSKEKL
jgi:hypothetical protein